MKSVRDTIILKLISRYNGNITLVLLGNESDDGFFFIEKTETRNTFVVERKVLRVFF